MLQAHHDSFPNTLYYKKVIPSNYYHIKRGNSKYSADKISVYYKTSYTYLSLEETKILKSLVYPLK